MAPKKEATKKPLTIEQRMDRLEKSFQFLQSKLRTHGIHLAPDTQAKPEPEEGEGE